MIQRYVYGKPYDTGAVVRPVRAQDGAIPYFSVTQRGDTITWSLTLHPDEMIFGLGEQVGGINRRGQLLRSWNEDQPVHTEDQPNLYASHNLLLFTSPERLFGVYFDDPGEMTFDLGWTDLDRAVITSVGGNLNVYVLTAESLTAICREFRGLTGRSYMAPRWAFGYIQSRWGYASDEDARQVAREHRKRGIPLDGICMDIDYMDGFRDFTWNRELMPDLPKLTADLREDHVHLIPIMDAAVKEDPESPVYAEGHEKGFFCKRKDGRDFVGAVWPGRSALPDFLNSEARRWFGEQYRPLLDAGIDAFWNDMNEPALFYSEDGLRHAWEMADKLRSDNPEVEDCFRLRGVFMGMANDPEDYRHFYHRMDGADGETVRHDRVHNLYGAMMTLATADALRQYDPSRRHLLFSRSSFIGAHRYGGVWQGDNYSWWSHILLEVHELASLNMCGFLYSGADLGGFGKNTQPELLLRWLQLGVFTPLMRNHSAQHTRDQEIYRFTNWQDMRAILTVRYALIPYLYSEYMKAALNDGMLFRPLAFDYPQDADACRTEDQLMWGEDCMIAPVYTPNARGRHVYLPEDMAFIRFRSAEDYDVSTLRKGHRWVELKANEMALFIRRGHVIPLATKPAEYVDAIDTRELRLLGWLDKDTAVTLYEDDGFTPSPKLDAGLREIQVWAKGKRAEAASRGMPVEAADVVIGG